MFRRVASCLPAVLALVLLPSIAFAQTGNISGTVRDSQGAVLPGVTVDVSSPALIEKVRTATTDNSGRFQIVSLPVGTYTVTFKLESFNTLERGGIELTSDFTAPVNVEMAVGTQKEVVTVVAQAPVVDVKNVRQRQVISGEEIRDLPTTRDLPGLVNLVPGISLSNSGGLLSLNSTPTICSGGGGGFVDNGGGLGVTTTGGTSGCNPLLNDFNAHSSINDATSLSQSRIQVDGLSIQNTRGFGGTQTPYLPDVANASEVTFTLSGSLGESETGGTTINIVPRTGGNRFAGNFFTSYAGGEFYDRNNGTRAGTFLNRLDYDYDANISDGGPNKRDLMWFQGSRRQRSRENLNDSYPNANAGIFGANYRANFPEGTLGSQEMYRNASLRLTLQATKRDKFNIFWDEQFTCQNPCEGTGSGTISLEAQGTQVTYPLHLAQVRWTNPLTNRILLDAGISNNSQHNDQTRNRYTATYSNIPRVTENGATVQQGDPLLTTVTSGSLNQSFYINTDAVRTSAAISYITSSHNVKVGYVGQFLQSQSTPRYNDLRLDYTYTTPAAPNPATGSLGCYFNPVPLTPAPTQVVNGVTSNRPWCGAINLPGNPNNVNDPINSQRLPVPTSFTPYIPIARREQGWFTAFYVQDQWTFKRLTLNGAVRYDNAQSRFLETCYPSDLYTSNAFCVNVPDDPDPNKRGKGVNFNDITPRWSVAWDVFGNGKTALKYSMGKYLNGATLAQGSAYTAANVAGTGRFINTHIRGWTDVDGDRVVDGCNMGIPAVAPGPNVTVIPAEGECAAITSTTVNSITNYRRWGRSPDELDESGLTVGLGEIQCGRTDSTRIPAAAQPYCEAYYAAGGSTLLNGWGKRRYEWQLSAGIQHELFPRMSVEVTYNHRTTKNATISDDVGVGCDLYGPTANDPDACIQRQLDFQSEWYDFYAIRAPSDTRLPNGGGYLIPGFANRKPGVTIPSTNQVTVQTLDINDRVYDVWRGVDVNVTIRARGGLRLFGGTSTGSRHANTCRAMVDQADLTIGVVLREGRERGCDPDRPLQTNVRASASYTIPWADVLLSAVFAYRPGVTINASQITNISDLVWMPGSEYRATYSGPECTSGGVVIQGCLTGSTSQTVTQNLVSNDTFGEGSRLFDIKVGKNFRFARKRVNVGFDIYNVFNSDAALSYCTSYPTCGTGANQLNWRDVRGVTAPRFARFQVQFDF